MFQLRYYKMVQNFYKRWLLLFEQQESEKLQTISEKSKNLKFNGFLSKKYIPLAKTLYTEDLSNITLNYLRENSPNY